MLLKTKNLVLTSKELNVPLLNIAFLDNTFPLDTVVLVLGGSCHAWWMRSNTNTLSLFKYTPLLILVSIFMRRCISFVFFLNFSIIRFVNVRFRSLYNFIPSVLVYMTMQYNNTIQMFIIIITTKIDTKNITYTKFT